MSLSTLVDDRTQAARRSGLRGAMLAVMLAGAPASALATTIYASPTGSGTACTSSAPCSLFQARDLARTLIPTMTSDIHVVLFKGTYALSAPFELLGNLDSGTPPWHVIYEADAKETPVLSGGVAVTGWVPLLGNRWRAPAPPGLQTRQLYVNGVRAQRTRSPMGAPGFNFTETPAGYTVTNAAMSGWLNESDIEIVDRETWKLFRCSVADIAPDAIGSRILMDEPCWSLSQWHQGAGFDYSMKAPDLVAGGGGLGWIENAFELMSREGDWYHDRPGGFIYYIPRPGENMLTAEVVAAKLETLVRLEGTLDVPIRNVKFVGLTFADATWLRPSGMAGYPVLQSGNLMAHPMTLPWPLDMDRIPGNVVLRAASGVTFEGNTFRRLGAGALALEFGSRFNTIVGNRFEDVSGGAVSVGDVNESQPADPRAVLLGNVIRNNYMTDVGVEYWDNAAIWAAHAVGTVIERNEIHNVPYDGISFGWLPNEPTVASDNLIERNLIHNVTQKLIDGGPIYITSDQPNSTILRNYLHNQTHNFAALYLDIGARHHAVKENVIVSAPYWYLLAGGTPYNAFDNTLQGNWTDSPDTLCGDDCLTTNDVSDNTILALGAIPGGEALTVMREAGVEAAYLGVKGGLTRVEAEDYDAGAGTGYSDLSPGNAGGAYRTDDVDLYADWTPSNGIMVGGIQAGETLSYHVDAPVTTATYEFGFTVGTVNAAHSITLKVDGVATGTVPLPNTGGYLKFQTVSLLGVYMTQGPHIVTLQFNGGADAYGFNLDSFNYDWCTFGAC
jgi:hypothetical protein